MQGTFGIEQSRLQIDMSEKIAELEPDKSPLVTLTKKMKRTRVVKNPEFDWLEQELGSRWSNTTATATDVATTITVAAGGFFRAGDLVKVPRTAETLLVTAVSVNTLTVIRSWGAVPAAAINNAEPLVIIGNANAEGATLRAILQREPVRRTGFTQIVRTPVGVTSTLQATSTHGPRPLSWYRHVGGIEHAVDMERIMLFGERNRDQVGSQHRRTTGGILEHCTENILNVSATTLTEQSFVQWMETVFRFGSKEKILFACARLCTHIDLWGMGKLQTRPREKTYGLAVKEYMTTHGTLNVIKHHLLEGAVYGGFGLILDMENIAYCPLEGRDTRLLTNRQANDEDAHRDEYLTEFGIEVMLPRTHAIVRGVA